MYVDENGIPHKGFIQADKRRKLEESSLIDLFSEHMEPEPEVSSAISSSQMQMSAKAIMMIGLPVLLALAGGISYLLSENQQLTAAVKKAEVEQVVVGQQVVVLGQKLKNESNVMQSEIVALQNKLEQQRRQVAMNAEQSLAATLSGLQKELNTDKVKTIEAEESLQNDQLFDNRSLSQSDPLSGYVLESVDPEIARLRNRTADIIRSQNSL